MSMILFNPTDEEMECVYIGERMVIPPAPDPRHKIKVDDARGRFALNFLGNRGLVSLEYGDEGEGELKKAEIGRNENQKFKRKMVMDFNQLNDMQQQRRLPYFTPDERIKKYARQLGIALYEPMSTKDDVTRVQAELEQKVQEKDREVQKKDAQISDLTAKVDNLTALVEKMLVAAGRSAGADALDHDWEEIKKKVKGLNSKYLQGWVQKNFREIENYPPDVKGLVVEQYEKLYSVPFPKNEHEAQAIAA